MLLTKPIDMLKRLSKIDAIDNMRSTGTIVYGKTVEPGGMQLDKDSWEDACPDCGKNAVFAVRETAHSGCINLVSSVFCHHCGLSESDGDEDY